MPEQARVVAALRPFRPRNYEALIAAGTTVADMLDQIGANLPGLEYFVSVEGRAVQKDRWETHTLKSDDLVAVQARPSGGGGEGGKNPWAVLLNLAMLAGTVFMPGTILGSMFLGALGKLGAATAGAWLVNKIAPPPQQDKFASGQSAGVNAGNALAPYATVPYLCGTHRFYPAHATHPWHDKRQKKTYVLYTLGPGPFVIDQSTFKLGDRLMSDISGIEIEVRRGFAADEPRTIFPPLQHENVQDAFMEEDDWTPVITTTIEADQMVLEFHFPEGIRASYEYGGGTFYKTAVLQFHIRVREVGEPLWQEVTVEGDSAGILRNRTAFARAEAFRVKLTGEVWNPSGVSAQYQVQCMWDDVTPPEPVGGAGETAVATMVGTVKFYSLCSYYEQDPIVESGIASVGMIIPDEGDAGIEQSWNSLSWNQFNLVASRILPVWTGAAWETYAVAYTNQSTSSNPAAIIRDILAGPGNARRADFHVDGGTTQLDNVGLGAFYTRCAAQTRPWTFDGIFDQQTTIFSACAAVAAVGRASFGIPEGKFGVIMDQDAEGDSEVQAFTVRNSADFSAIKNFPPEVHAYRMEFYNADVGYVQDETYAYAQAYEPPGGLTATRFERLEAFGITDPDKARDYGRYHIEDSTLRPEVYSLDVDAEGLICTRGDVVRVNHDVIEVGSGSGRIIHVVSAAGQAIQCVVDERFDPPAGHLACRIRLSDNTYVVRECVHTLNGDGFSWLAWDGDPIVGTQPAEGDLLMFGNLGVESALMVVTKIEHAGGLKMRLTLVDHAPGVHTPGVWEPHDSRITVPPVLERQPPAVPEILAMQSDESVLERGQDGSLVSRIVVSLRHPTGYDPGNFGAPVYRPRPAAVQLQYRIWSDDYTVPWSIATFDGAVESVDARNVEDGVEYELRVRAISQASVASAWSVSVYHTVIGKSTRPDPPTNLILESDVLRWLYPNPPVDLAGFEIRHHQGDTATWENATPLHSGLIAQTYHKLPDLHGGPRTFFVKAVDTRYPLEAAYSETAALLYVDLSEFDLLNAEITDWSLSNWAVVNITGGTVVGTEIHANLAGSPDLFWGPGGDDFWGPAGDDFWATPGTDQYVEMTVWAGHQINTSGAAGDLEFFISHLLDAEGSAYKIQYQLAGGTPDDDGWLDWPGKIRLTPSMMPPNILYVKVITAAGPIQGKLKALKTFLEYPDIEERVIGHVIASTSPPTTIPLTKTYTHIEVLHAQITDIGAGAISWYVYSKAIGTPRIELLDAAGAPTTGTIDVYVKGYRAMGYHLPS